MDSTLKNAHGLYDVNALSIQELICNAAGSDIDEVSTPAPLVAKMSAEDKDSQKGLIPIAPDWEDDLDGAMYDAYAGGSTLNC